MSPTGGFFPCTQTLYRIKCVCGIVTATKNPVAVNNPRPALQFLTEGPLGRGEEVTGGYLADF